MRRIIRILIFSMFIILLLISIPSCRSDTLPEAPFEMTDTTAEMLTDAITSTHTEESSTDGARGHVVCIDAGHQKGGIFEKEPIGPGSDIMKSKLSSGTVGVYTGVPEYVLTLEISLILKNELILRGYEVIMIRETHDCPLSNAERAMVANESGSDVFVRIHANGSVNQSVNGALTCAPTYDNPFLTRDLIDKSRELSDSILKHLCGKTGAADRGIYDTDTMSGINWSLVPVTIVEVGYMSNPEEDKLMLTEAYRKRIAIGIADGIDAYFKSDIPE